MPQPAIAHPKRVWSLPRPCGWLAVWVLLLGLAYALQVYELGRQDLWGDEAVSALVLKNNAAQILNGQVDPFHPPLYFLLLRAWTNLAGGSEFALRYLSLIGMMIAVAFVGRAARVAGCISPGRGALAPELKYTHVAGDPCTVAIAVTLAGVAPFLVYYAQLARLYGVALAFNAGALWAASASVAWAGSPQPSKFWRPWIVFAVLALGAVYAHYLSFLHLVGIALGLLLAWRRKRRLLAIAAGTAVAMGLAYLPWALSQMNRTGGQFPFRPQVWTGAELWRVVRDTLQAYSVGQTLYPEWGWGVVGLMVTAAVVGCVLARRWLPGVIVVAVLVAGWLFSAYLFAFEPRYLMMGMPAYLLLVAAGLRWVGRRWPGVAWLMLAVVVGAAGLANATYYRYYRKGNYGQLMRTVAAGAQPGDLLLLNNPLQRAIFEYYQPPGVDYLYLKPDVIIDPVQLDVHLTGLSNQHPRIWLVMFGDPNEYDPDFRVENWLASHGAKNTYAGFGDATLSLYVMAGAPGATLPVSVTFGNQVMLTGYRLSATAVRPGDTLIVELDWEATGSPERDYTIFVQLLDPAGSLLAQVDTQPVGGTRPTRTWIAGELVSDRYALIIPAGAPAGQCRLIVGLYPWPDLTRLPVTQAGGFPVAHDAVRLATLTLSR